MSLSLPGGVFSAYLFDCDGTIADTMPIHHRAWIEALAEWNCDFPLDLFYAWAGIPIVKTVEMLNQAFGLHMPAEVVARRREAAYFAYLPTIRPVADVAHHIHLQYGKIPFAVVSGSPRESIIKTLTALNLLDRFPVIVGAEDYRLGKPNPEPFLTAAARLGVAPKECLVFEDADLGVQAAQAAGMNWVKVPQRRG